MKRSVYLLVLIWSLCIASFAAAETLRPALWQAAADDREVWLFGSLHYGEAGFYPLPDAVTEAFEQADLLAVEINLLDIDTLALGQRLMTEGMYPSLDENLRDHIDDRSWHQLQAAAERFAMPIELLQQQRPWLAAMTLSSRLYHEVGLTEQQGLDMHFLDRARQLRKPIVELEGMDSQLDLFLQLDEATQKDLLRLTLDQLSEGEAQLRELIDAWRRGDTRALQRLIEYLMLTDADNDELYRLLLTERNRDMAEHIDTLAAER